MNNKVLIAGYGYLGQEVANCLETFKVYSLSRTPRNREFHIEANLNDANLESKIPDSLNTCIYCPSPNGRTEKEYREVYLDGLKNMVSALKRQENSPLFVLVSSTSVYGQGSGEEVDEESEALGARSSSKIIIEGENFLRSSPLGTRILRLSGIYGPGRTSMMRKALELEEAPETSLQYTNRIHVKDAARFIEFLIEQRDKYSASGTKNPSPNNQSETYIVSDSRPETRIRVINWLRAQSNLPELKNSSSQNSGKKCNNQKLLRTGFKLEYPSFMEGYKELLENA